MSWRTGPGRATPPELDLPRSLRSTRSCTPTSRQHRQRQGRRRPSRTTRRRTRRRDQAGAAVRCTSRSGAGTESMTQGFTTLDGSRTSSQPRRCGNELVVRFHPISSRGSPRAGGGRSPRSARRHDDRTEDGCARRPRYRRCQQKGALWRIDRARWTATIDEASSGTSTKPIFAGARLEAGGTARALRTWCDKPRIAVLLARS